MNIQKIQVVIRTLWFGSLIGLAGCGSVPSQQDLATCEDGLRNGEELGIDWRGNLPGVPSLHRAKPMR